MPKPVNCRYFYGDYFRGKNHEECRLIEANPENTRPWKRKLCDTCPVPELLIASNSRDLALEAEVRRKFLRDQVEVTFAVCTKHMRELDDPRYCPDCAAERAVASGESGGGFG
ncbi:MAG: hypothetical protein KDE20_11690 [Caldilineaceae bacterium]|nr:hypothetical protein [Caldilineaceae bacterium]